MVHKPPSELFFERTKRRAVYNIVALSNIHSILQKGILSFNKTKLIQHDSIALNAVQARRDRKQVPNGLPLHDYANVYFDPRNPMLYKRQDLFNEICILAIDSEILNIRDVVLSDGNAACDITRFYSSYEGMAMLEFDNIYARWWTDSDHYIAQNKKRIKCAEVLVPHQIPPEFIKGAIVCNDTVLSKLKQLGFRKTIFVCPDTFFRKE